MMRIFRKIEIIVSRLENLGIVLAAGSMLLLVVLTVIETLSRYLFRSPLVWAIEVPSYLLTVSTGLALAYTQKVKGHIAVGIAEECLSRRNMDKLNVFVTPLYLAAVTFLSVAGFILMWKSFVEWRVSDVMYIPLFLPQASIFVGFTLLWFRVIVDLGETINRLRDGEYEEIESKGEVR